MHRTSCGRAGERGIASTPATTQAFCSGSSEPPEAPVAQKPVLAQGTSMQVEIIRQYPMKAGESIEGRLMHPIYADGHLAVAQHTLLHGKVVALQPDKKSRLNGRLRGDFTPFHTAEVQFDELMLPTGPVPVAAAAAANGAPVLQLSTPGATPKRF